MANGKQRINIELGFSADTNSAKAQIQSLNQALNSIVAGKNLGNSITEGIEQGIHAAAELKTHLQAAVNVDTGKLNLVKFQESLRSTGSDITTLMNSLTALGPHGKQAFQQLSTAIALAEVPVFNLNAGLQKLGRTLMNTLRWQVSSSLISGFVTTITEAVNYVSELNSTLNDIRIVTGYGADEMDRFAERANKAAKALSTTTNEYAKASLIYFQQGLNDAEVEKRTNVTVKLANVTGESAETVSEWMTAVWNNFDNGSKSLEHYADVMTALGAATASSSDEIAGGLEKFAAIAKTIGLSYEYAASALATVTAITRQSEDVVGTAFKTIFARMEGLTLGETLEDGTSLNKYSESLKAIGVDIMDVTGELKSMDVILNDMGSRWNVLTQAQKVAVAQSVGGMRQYNQLIALMDNWEYFQENLNIAMGSQGELNKQADIYAESWKAARDRVSAAVENIYNELLNDDAFIGVMDFFADLLNFLDKTIDSMGGLHGVLLLVSSVLLKTFSKQIATSISNTAFALQGLFTGQKSAQKMQDDVVNNLYKQAGSFYSDAETAQKEAYVGNLTQEAELEQQILDLKRQGKEMEASIYQTELDGLKIRNQETLEIAKQVDLLKQQKTASFKDLSLSSNNIISSDFSTPKIRLEIAEITQSIQQGTMSTEALETQLKNLRSIEGLNPQMVQMLEQFEQIAKGAITSSNDLVSANKNLKIASDNSTRSYERMGAAIQKVAKLPPTLGQQLVNLSGQLTSIAFALTSIFSIIDTVKDKNMSFGDKFLSIVMSLSFVLSGIVPLLIGVVKAVKNWGTQYLFLAGAKAADAAATELQAKAEEHLNMVRKKGSFDLADGTQLSYDKKSKRYYHNGEKISKDDASSLLQQDGIKRQGLDPKTQNFKGLGSLLGKIGLVAAAIAAVVATVVIFDNVLNAHNKAAEKAAKTAKTMRAAADDAAESYNKLKESFKGYKDGIESLEKLTKGTLEYKEAVHKANQEARILMDTYGSEIYKGTTIDGLIELDQELLAQKQEEEFARMQITDTNARLAEINAKQKQNEADIINYQRSNWNKTDGWEQVGNSLGGALGGAAGGALAGAALGTVIGPIGWALGAGIGAIIGAIGGSIASTTAGNTSAAEEKAFEQLQKEYERQMKATGNADDLFTDQGLRKALNGVEGVTTDLINSLIEDKESVEKLIASNYELLEQEKRENLELTKNINQNNKTVNGYLYQDAIYAKQAKDLEDISEEMKNIDLGTWSGKDNKALIEYMEYTYGSNWRDNYKLENTFFGDVNIKKKNDQGEWVSTSDGDNLSKTDIKKVLAKKHAAEITDKEFKDWSEEINSMASALRQAGVYSLEIQNEYLQQAINDELTDLSAFSEEQIDKLKTNTHLKDDVEKAAKYYESEMDELQERLSGVGLSSYFDTILGENANKISLDNKQMLENLMNQAFEEEGFSGARLLTDFLKTITDPKTQMQVANVISTFTDWGDPGAQEYLLSLIQDIAPALEINENAFNTFSSAMIQSNIEALAFGNGLDSLLTKLSNLQKKLKDIEFGEIISAEDYEELVKDNPFVKEYFRKAAGGYISIKDTDFLSKQTRVESTRLAIQAITPLVKTVKAFDIRDDNTGARLKEYSGLQELLTREATSAELDNYIRSLANDSEKSIIFNAIGKDVDHLLREDASDEEKINALNEIYRIVTSDEQQHYEDKFMQAITAGEVNDLEDLNSFLEYFEEAGMTFTEEFKDLAHDIVVGVDIEDFLNKFENSLKAQVNKLKLSRLETAFDRLADNSFAAAEKMNNITKQISVTGQQLDLANALYKNIEWKTEEEFLTMTPQKQEEYLQKVTEVYNTYQGLQNQTYQQHKQMVDIIVESFNEWNEQFDRLNEKAEYFATVIDSYKSIVNLTREWTDIDSKLIKQLNQASVEANKTQLKIAENQYKALATSEIKIRNAVAKAYDDGDEELAAYWEKQLQEISSQVQSAHKEIYNSWVSTMESVADAYKDTIEAIFNDFEKQMTGKFNGYEGLMEYYEQRTTLNKLYLADYEKIYELSKLMRNIETSIDETDSLKEKARLRELQTQINKLSSEDTEMTKYQLEYLQKQYDLRLAEIALEEAQSAKHSVRLQRTESGSWGYVYTADETKIDEAQQKYEDKIYNLQELNAEYINELISGYFKTEQEWSQALEKIMTDEYESEEARQTALDNANSFYSTQAEYYNEQLKQAVNDNNYLYSEDTLKYLENTDKKLLANSDYYKNFQENVLNGTLAGYDSIEARMKAFISNLGQVGTESSEGKGLLGEIGSAYQDYKKESGELLERAGADWTTLGKQIANTIGVSKAESANGKSTGIVGHLDNLKSTSNSTFIGMISDMDDVLDKFKTNVPDVIGYYDQIEKKLEKVAKKAYKFYYWTTKAAGKDPDDYYDGIVEQQGKQENAILRRLAEENYDKAIETQNQGKTPLEVADILFGEGAKYFVNDDEKEGWAADEMSEIAEKRRTKQEVSEPEPVKEESYHITKMGLSHELDPYNDVNVSKGSELYVNNVLYYKYGKTDGYVKADDWRGYKQSSSLGSVQINTVPDNIPVYRIEYYDTGGYTGAWGPEGRWAMLHQKEIVLNATDTENFLSAIGILRSIVEMIDLRAATNAFNSSTLRAQNISTQSQILEQQVTIHAEFPNVIDHYEIETALNDIVNSASQYANRKI